ncbi:MAG: RES family NAD+ phosphorylase [Acidimicrobiia bacterium]|nr:RES family NAD+ phosphorylase [Acidimicrobiia bacterium]
MGIMKSLMLEQQEYGFSRSGFWDEVCRHCIADDCLAEYVSQGDLIERCRFCGRSDTAGVLVDELFRHMVRCLRAEWDDPIQGAAWEGGYIGVQLVDSDDLLSHVGEPLGNEDLRQEFVSAFYHDWCSLPFYGFDEAEKLIYSWERFRQLTTNNQFQDHTAVEPVGAFDDFGRTQELLEGIGQAISQVTDRLFGTTNHIQIVRGRAENPAEKFSTIRELGPPPAQIAGHNRMSRAGVSVFYGAESVDTTLKEIKDSECLAATVGCWTPGRELRYLDLLAAEPVPSIFDTDAGLDRQVLRFMASFAEDLAQRVDKQETGLDYVPTQIVTEYIRDHLLDGAIDAIRYPSAEDKPDGVCWVVFTDSDECQGPDPLLILDPASVRRYEPCAW